jgi:hypothetical protein
MENIAITETPKSTLHVPSNKDVDLYRHFLTYFDDEVYLPFLQPHRVKPEHNIWRFRHLFAHIRDCML